MATKGGDRSPHLQYFTAILWLALLIKFVLLFILAWNSRFVMDEFWQLGNGKYVFNGFFESVYPGKAIGYAIFYKLSHMLGWDSRSILLIGRIQTALVGCGVVAATYGCARRLGENKTAATIIVLVLFSFSNFIERIFRTISEPLAVFFAVVALLVVLKGKKLTLGCVLLSGILSGFAFITTQKAVYFNVASGVALVSEPLLRGATREGLRYGTILVLGWSLPVAVYCIGLGGPNPGLIVSHLFIDSAQISSRGINEYGTLTYYLIQTLIRNCFLYLFCLIGIIFTLVKFYSISTAQRVALIYSAVIAGLIFTHDQPWPYVFIMAQPFLSLWSLRPFYYINHNSLAFKLAAGILTLAIAASFYGNVRYLKIDNAEQFELLARAEVVVKPADRYFDGTGMLPNRFESTPIWLDRRRVNLTLRDKQDSDAYRSLANEPPKVILWSYRMDAIEPVIGGQIQKSYVQISPNIRIAGRALARGEPTNFSVPVGGSFALYTNDGTPVSGQIDVDGKPAALPIQLKQGGIIITLRRGPDKAFLLPKDNYVGIVRPDGDNRQLFADVYK